MKEINDQEFEQFKNFSDQQLKDLFWEKIETLVHPILELSKTKTTPSIERSVLLRMGFSSLEAHDLVKKAIDENLIKYGAGHIVYIVSRKKNLSIREAGKELINNNYWSDVESWIKEGK